MDLWIRSQDKEDLIKARNIRYWGENQIAVNIWTSYNNINYVVVGEYATKERALEVLDEIQNILQPKYILDSSSIKKNGKSWVENGIIMQEYNANATIQEISTYVYEMPEE